MSYEPKNLTHVIMFNSADCEIARVSLEDDDATTEAIAQAAIDIIRSCYSMSAGDKIIVTED